MNLNAKAKDQLLENIVKLVQKSSAGGAMGAMTRKASVEVGNIQPGQKEELFNFLFTGPNGLKRVAPQPGDAFDPHLHQAMMEQPSDTVPGGAVLQTMQAGFELFGRTVRPAMVVVAAKGSGGASSGGGNPYAAAPASGQTFDGKA